MTTIARLGIDTSKSLFQLHGVNEREETVLRKQVRRSQFLRFVGKLAATEIGLEACGASHYWARELQALGHAVVLLPPQHVKPYAGHNKNDKIDAEAICEAGARCGSGSWRSRAPSSRRRRCCWARAMACSIDARN